MKKYSDEELISKYLKGDEKALVILIERYLRPIYSFTCRLVGDRREAEDVTQEVFIKVWRNLNKFKPEYKFKTWVFNIAKNASFDFLRKKKSIPFSILEDKEGKSSFLNKLADPAPLASEIIERKDIAKILTFALEKISPKYRTVLFLRYNDHFTFREIAESIGEPLHTVKSRHRRAIIILKELLAIS